MYEYLLLFHSWFRWLVLILATVNIFMLITTPFTADSIHSKLLWFYDQIFGYQFFMGLTMWLFASPIVKVIFSNWKLIFHEYIYFFWGVQHPLTMTIALGVWHSFSAKARRTVSVKKYLMGIAFSTLLVLTAIPWPWLKIGRNLFRWYL